MTTGFASSRERIDREVIRQNTQVGEDPVTQDKILILPVFNMHDVQTMVPNRKVIVLESDFIKHTLAARKIYVAFDLDQDNQVIDPRPFVYAGDPGQAYGGKNEKIRIAHLIKGLNNNQLYDQKVLRSFTKDPCSYLDKNMDNCVPHNIIVSGLGQQTQIVKTAQSHINQVNQSPKREKLELKEKVKKAINSKNGSPSLMESIILKGEKPNSADAIKDINHKWLGVSSKETKQGKRYVVTCKDQYLGTYENPVDAARAYNDFVIDNGLPYPVNNIPGFLKLKFVGMKKQKSLAQHETWELANELSTRLTPEWMKF